MGRHTGWPLLLVMISTMLSISAASDTIAPGDLFGDGDSLISANGRFRLGFFTPGRSKLRYLGIWYNISVQTIVWVANRELGVPDFSGVLSISRSGNLVLSGSNGTIYWSTGAETTGLVKPVARLLNTSNFVITGDSGGNYSWQSFNNPTDSLLPGMMLGWNRRAGRNNTLTAWRSADDPAPGEFAMRLDTSGDSQIFLVRGARPVWRSGWWLGQGFSGIPDMLTYNFPGFTISFFSSEDWVYYTFDARDDSLLFRLVVHPTGVAEHLVWNYDNGAWIRLWMVPKDKCDFMNTCGPFGLPAGLRTPVAAELVPERPQRWMREADAAGLPQRERRVRKVGGGKAAGHVGGGGERHHMGLGECRAACLRNCSCTAYANAEVTGAGGRGCILWGGNLTDLRGNTTGGPDLFVREAAADLAQSTSSSKRVLAVKVVGAAMGTVALGWMCWFLWWRRRKTTTMRVRVGAVSDRWKENETIITLSCDIFLGLGENSHAVVGSGTKTRKKTSHAYEKRTSSGDDHDLPLIDFGIIAAATDGFSAENKLGEGGFGPVYVAWSLWKVGKWTEMVDSSMGNCLHTTEVLKCINVGLLCVQERPEDRPTMASVVEMWGDNTESLPQPKQPGFMATRGPFEVWSLSKGKLCSINEVTVSTVKKLSMGRHTGWPLLLIMISAMLSISAAADTIAPGDLFGDGDSLISANGRFRLGFFTPSRSKFRYLGIWYNTISVQTIVWVANRELGVPDLSGVLSISRSGNLVLSGSNGTIYWSTDAATGLVKPVARLLNTSNFVITGDSGGNYSWQSFNNLTDSLLPGMMLGWNRRAGRNNMLTAWRSADDPATGEFAMRLDTSGDSQIFLMRGARRVWRSGWWNGRGFSGIPDMFTYNFFVFTTSFFSSQDWVYYTFDARDDSLLLRLVVHPTGVSEHLVWNYDNGAWIRLWMVPKDQCDLMNTCGPFGVCNANDSSLCSCLRGFEPPSPQNWYRSDRRDGCVRRTPLDCPNGNDGFVQVAGAKLPDTSAAVVNGTMELGDCRAACLRNCSCTAYASAEVTGAGGSGCILWGGNLTDLRGNTSGGPDLFVRVAAADLGLGENSHAVVGSGTKTKKKTSHPYEKRTSGDDHDLPLIDFGIIAAATDGFSAENKLGEGGFGPVYVRTKQGRLGEGQEVAVKRLAKNSVQGVDEFKNEVVLIAKLQHRNLVRLLGCCIQGEERMLVYEYMPNKSLDAFLFDKTNGSLLDWNTRYKIIKGIARGLLYLHQDSRLRIIHRDLKASNVLLDKEMNPKISDFGMARMFSGDQTEANTRRVVGTYGYMSPEYIMQGLFSVKSDVFSFGVVVLEMVSGKRNRGIYLSDPNLNLLGYAWSLWKAGKWMEMVDSSMGNCLHTAEVLKCINVGLLCVQERPEDRPTMASVVEMWGDNTESLPQPKQPGFMATRGPFEVWSLSKGKLCSINEVTVTMCDGR
ncbi:hypothetical protein Taro_001521 [Colocasia esculenta]|uniref:non-specific serine/threonine protein kinase n=1 Tax=Colocasia esculenta TaxID=4460 RepID=A0A843TKS9_COLES|nr:hypothetical protein [Colocasia esculenta]